MKTILTFEVAQDALADEFSAVNFKYIWLVKNDNDTYTVCFGDENYDTPEECVSSTSGTTFDKAVVRFMEEVDATLTK